MKLSIVMTDNPFMVPMPPQADSLDMKLSEWRTTGRVLRRLYTLSLVHIRLSIVNKALHLVILSKSHCIALAVLSHLFKRSPMGAFHVQNTIVFTPMSLDLDRLTMRGRFSMSRLQIQIEII